MIKSENARPNGWIFVDIEDVDIGHYVEQARRAVAERIDLPPGYSLAWSGQYEYMERAKQRLAVVVPITLVIIVLLLFLNFRNLVEVAIIIGTMPTALIGGIWLLYLLDYNLSVAVGVGFIALAGVAVEIGVVMLLYLNQSLDDEREKARAESRSLTESDLVNAVRNGALLRLRPIVMTVATIVVGLLPIMSERATDAQFLKPAVLSLAFGVLFALFVTLLMVPALYAIGGDCARGWAWLKQKLFGGLRGSAPERG